MQLPIIEQHYKTYIRPIIDFGSEIYYPYTIKNSRIIELVQKRITRTIVFRKFRKYYPYNKRLELLDLQPLNQRRLINDMVTFNKIINSKLKIENKYLPTHSINSNQKLRFITPFAKLNCRYHSYFVRNTRLHNKIGHKLPNFKSYSQLRKTLSTLDLEQFIK